MDKVIEALVLLVERTCAIVGRLERIESKISELSSTRDKSSPARVDNAQPGG